MQSADMGQDITRLTEILYAKTRYIQLGKNAHTEEGLLQRLPLLKDNELN